MLSQKTHQQIYFWALAYLCFSVPFMSKWMPFTIGVAALALNYLLEGNFLSKLKTAFAEPWALLLIIFYILHLLSVSYSTNVSEANRDIFLKLPLFILPLVLPTITISREQKNRLFLTWILATTVAAVIMLVQAYVNVQETGSSKYWFYAALAGGKHPAYFSMYCVTAIVLLFQDKFEKWKVLPFMLLLVVVFLLSSRMQILVLLVIAFAKAWQVFFQNKKARPIVIVLLIGFMSIFVSETIRSKIRLNAAKKEIAQLFSQDFKNSIRGAIWNFGLHTIKESPWIGHGNGDEFQLLNQRIQSKVQLKESDVDSLASQVLQDTAMMNSLYATAQKEAWDEADVHIRYAKWKLSDESSNLYDKFYKHHYNYHNQFLQSWAIAGILCLLVLLAFFFIVIKKGIQNRGFTIMSLAFLIAMSFMSESMLERQYGVIYFALILPLILLDTRKSA